VFLKVRQKALNAKRALLALETYNIFNVRASFLKTTGRRPFNMEEQNGWYKLGDAAYLLGISEITLRRKLKTNQILHQFRNGKYLVQLAKDTFTGQWNTLNSFALSAEKLNDFKQSGKEQPSIEFLEFQNKVEQQIDLLNEKLNKNEHSIQALQRQIADHETLIQILEQNITNSAN
jgi:hypothetical protein